MPMFSSYIRLERRVNMPDWLQTMHQEMFEINNLRKQSG
jgi:hypothetical protein